jgi:hypothetical protein
MRTSWFLGIAFLMFGLACNRSADKSAPADVAQTVTPKALPPQERPVEKGQPMPAMALESLKESEFLAKFRFRRRPDEFAIGRDFLDHVDPKLYHFQRVEVILADGKRTEVRLQNFGAWAISKNVDGNWEMVTTMTAPEGTLMHFTTLRPDFTTIGSFEIARRYHTMGAETVKRGKFTNELSYQYVYFEVENGHTRDSVNGLMVVGADGNYKTVNESR